MDGRRLPGAIVVRVPVVVVMIVCLCTTTNYCSILSLLQLLLLLLLLLHCSTVPRLLWLCLCVCVLLQEIDFLCFLLQTVDGQTQINCLLLSSCVINDVGRYYLCTVRVHSSILEMQRIA